MLIFSLLLNMQSHPTWVRGLKLWIRRKNFREIAVAPYVGAWIETLLSGKAALVGAVAPYVGAWIETLTNLRNYYTLKSHPTWVRGLKRTATQVLTLPTSRTLRGCVD